MERVTIADDTPFNPNVFYESPHIGQPELTLSEQDAPPQDGKEPVRNFKR